MANIPMKDIQFPGLDDTYTFAQVDATLTTQGKAADAKKTGDEISELKADFNDSLYGTLSINKGELLPNKYINDQGNVASYNGWSATGFIELPDTQMFTIVASGSSDGSYNAFYNSSKERISMFSFMQGTNERTIPEEAKYMRLSATTSVMESLALSWELSYKKDIDALKDAVCTEIGDWIYGKGIDLSGGVGSVVSLTPLSNTNIRYTILDCSAGDIFTVNGYGSIAWRQWGFLDSSNKIIDVDGIRSHNQNKVLIAPQGTAKLVLNQYGADYSFENCYKGTFPVSTATNDIPGKST